LGSKAALGQASSADLRHTTVSKANFSSFNGIGSANVAANVNFSYTFSWSRTLSSRNGYILISQLQNDNLYHVVARFPTISSAAPLSGLGSVTSGDVFKPSTQYRLSYYS